MKNKELAELLMKNPDNECILGVFNGEVNTYSGINGVHELPAHGVYNDMFNTLDGEIDQDLFRYLGEEVIDKNDYETKVTYIRAAFDERDFIKKDDTKKKNL